jgi:aspartyl/glutamyl-tRNA(Asn/Gln) amidotransferase C subunit
MTTITRDEVVKLAAISSLDMREHEIDELVRELQVVLTYVSSLQKVVKAYEAQPQGVDAIRTVNVMRSDEPVAFDAHRIIERAPVREEDYFVVPIIVKQS